MTDFYNPPPDQDHPFAPTSEEHEEAMNFVYPCDLSGRDLELKASDFCEQCDIETRMCVDYWANGNPAYTFEEFLVWRKRGFNSQIKGGFIWALVRLKWMN